ncbi:MAG: hypothetical protein VX589_07120, partial [Myxococcota bacterium]|nr:hypothetical protein [Myxococcota bacterium]
LRPLIESLRHDMTAGDHRIWSLSGRRPRRVEDVLSRIGVEPTQTPAAFQRFARTQEQGVRSIQRLPRPAHLNGTAVAQEYLAWLPHFFRGVLRVEVSGAVCRFRLFSWMTLLELTLSADRTSPDRPLFYITGGILAAPSKRARLEFREILSNDTMVSAIHEYRPRLWWPIYRLAQAPFHAFVMSRFAHHLSALGQRTHEYDEPPGA